MIGFPRIIRLSIIKGANEEEVLQVQLLASGQVLLFVLGWPIPTTMALLSSAKCCAAISLGLQTQSDHQGRIAVRQSNNDHRQPKDVLLCCWFLYETLPCASE